MQGPSRWSLIWDLFLVTDLRSLIVTLRGEEGVDDVVQDAFLMCSVGQLAADHPDQVEAQDDVGNEVDVNLR